MKENKSEYSHKGVSLAIATIPCQEWSDVYEEDRALEVGTVFPDLNMPFYAASTLEDKPGAVKKETEGSQREKDNLLKKIDAVSFVVNDLTLYLDTHETDGKALAMFGESMKKRQELLQEFAARYYPLTQACMAGEGKEGTKFCWTDGPAPWEGVCE